MGAPEGDVRVVCGGRWYDAAAVCRSANRGGRFPEVREFFVGFRVAISALDTPSE